MATPDPTVAGFITRFKAAVALAESWVSGTVTTDVVGTGGTYPSLAKLTKWVTDQVAALLTNPVMTGNAGFTPPIGTTAQRDANPVKGRQRYNSTTGALESFTDVGWQSLESILISSYTGVVGVLSGTSKIPVDNTVPLITEGTQLWSKQVTPKAVGSEMVIEFAAMFDTTVAAQSVVFALFRDNVLIGVQVLGASAVAIPVIGSTTWKPGNVHLQVRDPVTSLTPVTYSCRIGLETSGTWYLGRGASVTMGGNVPSTWKIEEVLPS